MSVDVGVIHNGYHGDAAITVAVGEIDAKRMGLPGLTLRSKCPECGEVVSMNMNRDPYRLSYLNAQARGYSIAKSPALCYW